MASNRKNKEMEEKMNESGTHLVRFEDLASIIPKEKVIEQEVPTEEKMHNEEEFVGEDKELYNEITKIVNDPTKAKKVTKICLEWVNEQLTWGGKYDYLLEDIAGDDV